jgi:DNA-binding ferritin-like protein
MLLELSFIVKQLATYRAVQDLGASSERIAALGGVAGGTLVAISQRSGLNEYPLSQGPWQNDATRVASALMIIRNALGDDTELLVQIDDADSADRLGALGRAAEHYLGNLSSPGA